MYCFLKIFQLTHYIYSFHLHPLTDIKFNNIDSSSLGELSTIFNNILLQATSKPVILNYFCKAPLIGRENISHPPLTRNEIITYENCISIYVFRGHTCPA